MTDIETYPSEGHLSLETVREMNTLEIGASGGFIETLEKINSELGFSFAPREGDNFHVTVITPLESGVLKNLSEDQLEKLYGIHQRILSGEDGMFQVVGLGIIDGSSREDLREVDRDKKVCFLAVDIPELKKFREECGLPEKDFHITLGFEVNDIHMQVIGMNEKGKSVLAPIEKKADSNLDKYVDLLGKVTFEGFLVSINS